MILFEGDDQLVAVMRAVLRLPIEQGMALLRRIAIRLPVCVSRFSDTDFDKAVRVALREVMVCMALQEGNAAFRRPIGGPDPLVYAFRHLAAVVCRRTGDIDAASWSPNKM